MEREVRDECQKEVSQKCEGKEYYSLWHLDPYLDPDALVQVLTGLTF